MSRKIGRPKADNPKDVRYSIRLDLETESKLKKYCEYHGITKGEAIRRGIHTLLSKNE
jgi:predicted DNA-binding protein